jgi:hypothetical protein
LITWSGDVNLDSICEDINKYISRYKMKNYYIYGLQQADRPHVRVSGSADVAVVDLFKRSGYELEIVTDKNGRYCAQCDNMHTSGDCCCTNKCELCDPDTVSIGLRRDVRSNKLTARKLIKTLIFSTEGNLIVNSKSLLHLGRSVAKRRMKCAD